MIPVLLTRIKTKDGVYLDGIVVLPERKKDVVLIWVHGLGSRFSSGQVLIKELSALCKKNGLGYFKFNNRGHDVVNRDDKGRNKLQGGALEKFEESLYDIGAQIRFAKKLGFKKIILAGHSTGANKALYYIYKTKNSAVRGLILAAGLSDIAAESKRVGKKEIEKSLRLAKSLKGKRPAPIFWSKGTIYSPARYISLYLPGTAEDVFPYHNPEAKWEELNSVKIPTAVIIGSRDEYLGMPTKKCVEIFQKNLVNAKTFSGIIIRNTNHGFYKKEKELAKEVIEWIKKIK